VTSVAGRELRGLFVSPVAYGVLTLFAFLAGIFFVITTAAFQEWLLRLQQYQAFDQLEQINLNDHLIGQFYQSMTVVLLFLIPGVTMGFFAAEKTNGTQELLLTSPLTIWDIVLGKFLAGALFIALLTGMVGLYPLLLFVYGDPEVGKTLTGLLGVLLVGWVYVAIGLFASSMTRSQVIAFLLTFVLLLVLMILPAVADLAVAGSSGVSDVLRWLSTDPHVQQLTTGLVETSALAYFAVMIGSFLVLTKAAVESVRWR
jgi:ABC-2 type transport system permease protein